MLRLPSLGTTRPARRGPAARLAALLVCVGSALAVPALAVTPGDSGTWLSIPPSVPVLPRFASASAYDPVRHRMWVFGGQTPFGTYGDLFSRSLDAGGGWRVDSPNGTPPPGLSSASLVYDPTFDRLILFGGAHSGTMSNAVWQLDLGGTFTWTLLTPTGAPPTAREAQEAAYDATRHRMLVFGGDDAFGTLNDCWALDLSTQATAWSPVVTAGTPPGPRTSGGAIYDPPGDRLVVFGGFGSVAAESPHALQDAWSLSLAGTPTWSMLNPPASLPDARIGPAVCYDATRGRMLVAGGSNFTVYDADLWALDLTTIAWAKLSPGGQALSSRTAATAVYDPANDRVVVFGGRNATAPLSDEVLLYLSSNPVLATPPSARLSHKLSLDPAHHRAIVFGGILSDTKTLANDAYVLDLASAAPQWSKLAPATPAPPARSDQAQVYDPLNDRLIVFGGRGASAFLNDLWQYSFVTNRWDQPGQANLPPSARIAAATVYDPVGQRMILVGGVTSNGVALSDVWSLSLDGARPQWTNLTPVAGAQPFGRYGHTLVYDSARQRVVLHGGATNPSDLNSNLGDTWVLPLSPGAQWTQVVAGAGPSARQGHVAVYDSGRDRMVVFGGYDGSFRNDAWALNLGAVSPGWSALSPVGGPLLPRDWSAGVYDAGFDRLVLFGGNAIPPAGSAVPVGDAWSLQFGAQAVPVLASLLDASSGPGEARLTWFTPDGAGVAATVERSEDGSTWQSRGQILSDASGQLAFVDAVAAGGRYGYRLAIGPAQQRTEVTWLDVPAASSPPGLGLAGAWPNPAHGAPTLNFALAAGAAGPAVLEVFDVSGRRVYRRDVAALGAGPHVLDLRGAFPARAGVYLATLRTGGKATTRKFALLP